MLADRDSFVTVSHPFNYMYVLQNTDVLQPVWFIQRYFTKCISFNVKHIDAHLIWLCNNTNTFYIVTNTVHFIKKPWLNRIEILISQSNGKM